MGLTKWIPAGDVLAQFLINKGAATLPNAAIPVDVFPWPVYVNFMNDEGPDNAIHLFHSEGRTDGIIQRTGEVVEHYYVLMLLRAQDVPTGQQKATSIDSLITQSRMSTVVIPGGTYILQSAIRKFSLLHIEQEPKNRREVFRARYILSIRGT